VATKAIVLNAGRLVRTRLSAIIQPTRANAAVAPDGRLQVRPGQGGVALGIALGSPAGGWVADHLEPGVSLSHPDPAANSALQTLACAGNRVTMVDGPAAGAEGVVFGKHGAVLAMFAGADLARIAPGEWAVIVAQGVGLAVEGEPDFVCHSCSPQLLERLLNGRDSEGRLRVLIRRVLPAETAAAGIGMPVWRYNMDLHVDQEPFAELTCDLRFGDVVAVQDQDHRFGRQYRKGWLCVGVIAHGVSVAGGHGFGFMTLLTAPSDRIVLEEADDAALGRLLG
jgi:hypothetical protein